MPLAESLLIAMCANPTNKELQACRTTASAIYSTYYPSFTKINEVEEQLVGKLPVWFKHSIILADAYNKRYIYLPIIDRRF